MAEPVVIDALLDGYYVPAVHYRIDVVKGKKVVLIMGQVPDGAKVFHSPDRVLGVETKGNNITVEAQEEGEGLVRIMTGVSETNREIMINVVPSVGLPATSINATFDKAVPR